MLEMNENGVVKLSWRFISQSFNEIEILDLGMSCQTDGTVYNKQAMRCQFVSWSAWLVRWWLMKERLRIK